MTGRERKLSRICFPWGKEERRKMSRKMLTALGLILAAAWMLLFPAPAARAEEDKAEWTVLFYVCGSNLESAYSYATENLVEISQCKNPYEEEERQTQLQQGKDGAVSAAPRVKVLLQTGGCTAWHAEELGMDISAEALQRWRYDPKPGGNPAESFSLEATLPLQSMADPETLTDFIRWGAENYPAKKYALVMWGHGQGSRTGLMVDDLFGYDILYLDELKKALQDSGTHLEAILFDACMMANLGTANAVHGSADWMIASEELVAGKGTAVGGWLQEIYNIPECDGEMLGRWICDMTETKYANEENESARELLTWSVINLKKIPELTEYFEACYDTFVKLYEDYPELAVQAAQNAMKAVQFGNRTDAMMDLYGILYLNSDNSMVSSKQRYEAIKLMNEVVVYTVNGPGRTGANGLSFCNATSLTPAELEVYTRNCESPYYLALLDALSSWEAPDWVYEQVKRLPEITEIETYHVKVNKVIYPDGTPAITLEPGYDLNVGMVRYTLFQKTEDGRLLSLGTPPAYLDQDAADGPTYVAYMPWLWPCMEGQPCEIEALNALVNGDYNVLYNIPIKMDGQRWNLRCAYHSKGDYYKVYGLWNGIDSDSQLFDRNVMSLSQVSGREFNLLYDVNGETDGGLAGTVSGPGMTMYRAMEVVDSELPAGVYEMEYAVYDSFMRPMKLPRVEVTWDGERLTVTGKDWEGQETLKLPGY